MIMVNGSYSAVLCMPPNASTSMFKL